MARYTVLLFPEEGSYSVLVPALDTATAHQYEQRTADGTRFPHYYTTDQAFPRLGLGGFGPGTVLSVTYYDDYNFDNDAQGHAPHDAVRLQAAVTAARS